MDSNAIACRINKQYSKSLLYAMIVVLFLLFVSIFFFYQNTKEDELANVSDNIIKNFREGLDYEMLDLLSFSMALSEDGGLKNALSSEDESKGHKILRHITERFKKYTHLTSLRIQVLTPEFYIFARSWNEGYEGMPIWWFRDDLDKQILNPKVGMETGRLLTFKATIPVISAGEILGYLEVIKFIDEFSKKLQKKGIDLFALMDEDYLEKASLMRGFPRIKTYVVSNQNFNQQILQNIEMIDWEHFIEKKYLYEAGTLYLHEPMYNGKGTQIGMYLLALSADTLKRYEKEKGLQSFFTQFTDEDIEKVVESWKSPHDSFRSAYERDLFTLLPKLRKEDKVKLESEAKNILQTYDKNELIDIILDNNHKEQKVGEVK